MICSVCDRPLSKLEPRLKSSQGDVHMSCGVNGGVPLLTYNNKILREEFAKVLRRMQDLEREIDKLKVIVR